MKKVSVLCALSVVFQLSARTQDVSALSGFDFIIKQSPFTVVMVQPQERAAEQRSLNNLFSLVSRNERYQEAGVRFIRISEQKPWVKKLLNELGIVRTPAIIVYEGTSFKTVNHRPHALYGYTIDRNALINFIDSLIGVKVRENIEHKKQAAIWKLEQAKINYQECPLTYYYPCPGYFYPYWWYICNPGGNRISGCGSGWCF